MDTTILLPEIIKLIPNLAIRVGGPVFRYVRGWISTDLTGTHLIYRSICRVSNDRSQDFAQLPVQTLAAFDFVSFNDGVRHWAAGQGDGLLSEISQAVNAGMQRVNEESVRIGDRPAAFGESDIWLAMLHGCQINEFIDGFAVYIEYSAMTDGLKSSFGDRIAKINLVLRTPKFVNRLEARAAALLNYHLTPEIKPLDSHEIVKDLVDVIHRHTWLHLKRRDAKAIVIACINEMHGHMKVLTKGQTAATVPLALMSRWIVGHFRHHLLLKIRDSVIISELPAKAS